MVTSTFPAQLPTKIQSLLNERMQHADAISKIDKTLASIAAALTGKGVAAVKSTAPVAAKAPKAPGAKTKRRRSRFAESASDLVLAFVKANKSPTTLEIMKHLASKGRTASSGSNALSTLTTAKKLKRVPLGKGILGSRYSLA